MAHERFDVGGMTCAACQAHVDKAVCKLDGVQEVAVNLLSGSMTVDFDANRVSTEEICSAVDRAGYTASLAGGSASAPGTGGAAGVAGGARLTGAAGASRPESPTKKLQATADAMKGRLAVSLAFLVPLFYIGMGHMLGWPLPAVLAITTTP